MNKITERIERKAGVPGLVSILAEHLTPSDLQSLLLEVYRERSRQLQPATVLANYEKNRFVKPSAVPPTQLINWERVAYTHLPKGFIPVALSPVCPLGTNTAVAPVTQDWAVSTTRNTEVVSDATNVLALECASRRRNLLRENPRSAETVHLTTSHRMLRAQHYKGAHLAAHFSLFALCSAGRDQGSMQFEFATLKLHISFYLKALRAFLGSNVKLELAVTDFEQRPRTEILETHVLAPVRIEFKNVECAMDSQRATGQGYYSDICFHIYATAASGQRLELVDGGVVDWTQAYLSNAKERLVISGIGSERLCTEFGNGENG